MFTSCIKHRIRWFHVVFVQWRSKKCTKKRDARGAAGLLVKPVVFWRCRYRRPRGCLQFGSLFSLFNDLTCQSYAFFPVPCIPSFQFTRFTAVEHLFTPRACWQTNPNGAPTFITIPETVFHYLLPLLQSLSRQRWNAHMVSGFGHSNA